MTAIIRCEACHGSHVDGWAGCVALSGPTLAADALAPATGHTETLGTREGLTLARVADLRWAVSKATPFVGLGFVQPAAVHMLASDLAALLDAHEVLAEVRDQVKRGALCPMCATGMSRRTVGMVCQICGTDYGTR